MRVFLYEFLVRDDGPTAVEYAVMLALILAICIGAITTMGQQHGDLWDKISNDMPGGG